MLSLGTSLTNQNAATVLRDGLARVAQGDVQVDCTGLTQVDSAAVAVLLAWHRAAAARNLALSLRGVPAGLSQLASLYGVDGLLGLVPAAARDVAPEAELAFSPAGSQLEHHHRH
ncbi:lipid asymmetry maintenance protein MlaB [Cupriavidus sp. DF5525]|uniref:STAS domain-containing protein n=1 Tax=Cupriavidus sp. DF5525 TaxID=3160989 RepID=UPI0003B01C9E|nr:signal peptide protein [Ralstonia pickettii DTP0602]